MKFIGVVMSIFREKALSRLSSPENLDEALVAASPYHWVGYISAVSLVIVAVVWSIFGEIPTRVSANGILLHRDSEIFSASAEGNGELTDIRVSLGDAVTVGDVVALLDQDFDVRRLELAKEKLTNAIARQDDNLRSREEDILLRRDLLGKERASLVGKINNAKSRVSNLELQVAELVDLLERGFIERTRLLSKQNELIQVKEAISDQENLLVKLDVQDRDRVDFWNDRKISSDREIENLQVEIETITEQLKRISTVDAPITGIVTEISASLGDVVGAGAPVIRIMSDAAEMDALLFVPPADGKLIKPGLIANVEPSVAKKEEFGTIIANVRSVSQLPMSPSAIKAILHNDKLVQQFSANGPPIAVRADLREVQIPGDEQAFLWTGGSGPQFDIEHGTLVSATVTVHQQRPITLILPFLKSMFGL
jgi:HlyD family secretion protein